VHEIAIAQQIAAKVISEAAEAKAKNVVKVDITIGDLTFLDPVNMEMWIREALRNTTGKDAVIKIDVARSMLTCGACGFVGHPELPEHHDHDLPLPPLSCPHCGSPDTRLEEQRDCLLKRIELEV
jgi:hydrogenase nickel insertion protein HypA